MTFAGRLMLTLTGSLFGGFAAGLCVSLYDAATSKGMPLIGAIFIGMVLGVAYCLIALIASLVGNIVWLAVRPFAAPYEPYALPILIAVVDSLLLAQGAQSTDFFAVGGRWFPAGVLLITLVITMNLDSGNFANG